MDEHKIPRDEFDLVALMKFLVMEGSYRFILSGSLLGVTITDTVSWPTGYMTSFMSTVTSLGGLRLMPLFCRVPLRFKIYKRLRN